MNTNIPKMLCDLLDAARESGLKPGVAYLRPEMTNNDPQIVITLRGLVVENGVVRLIGSSEVKDEQ